MTFLRGTYLLVGIKGGPGLDYFANEFLKKVFGLFFAFIAVSAAVDYTKG